MFIKRRKKTSDISKVLLVWEERNKRTADRRNGTRVGSGYGLYNGNGVVESLTSEAKGPLFDTYNDKVSKSEKLQKIIDRINPDTLLITRPISYDTLTDTILNIQTNGKSVDFAITPEIYKKYVGKLRRTIKVNGSSFPCFNLKKDNHTKTYLILKRLIDISFSLLMFLLTLPILLVVPILIKLTSRGPVFYTQVRAGLNGFPFKLYKFRSMTQNADDYLSGCIDLDKFQEPIYKDKDDSRITWLGRLLRKTSIDELPQILNVLKGEMSWVGPRPEDVQLVKRYNAYFKEKLRARPGITGMQQIKYRGGPSLYKRLGFDVYYIEHQSLWLDFKILLKSTIVVLFQKGAW